MIVLLSKSEPILHIKVKNLLIVLLLLPLGVCFEVSYSIIKVSSSHYNGVMRHAPESPDFPLSIPFSTDEESLGMEDDFWDGDENINLSIISVFLSESICFHYQNNSILSGSLKPPFSPPKIQSC